MLDLKEINSSSKICSKFERFLKIYIDILIV